LQISFAIGLFEGSVQKISYLQAKWRERHLPESNKG
jgi:hypothetical protein